MQPAAWLISCVVPKAAADTFVDALEGFCGAVSWPASDDRAAEVRIEAYCDHEPDQSALRLVLAATAAALGVAVPAADVKWLPVRDWLAENRRSFAPFAVGRYFVHGSDFSGPRPAARISLRVDAGLAFGSGRHESTAGCLEALDGLAHRRFRNALDMGCGSAILTIAVARTWGARVVAADVDPIALRVAAANVHANGVSTPVRIVHSDGYAARAIRARGPYDLIVANILARPLCRMAKDLRHHLRPGGTAVLGGFLVDEAGAVLAAHEMVGLRLVRHIDRNGWRTLVMRRPRRA